MQGTAFSPWVGTIPGEGNGNPLQCWKSHGQRSLMGYSPWGHKRAGHDLMTKQQQQTIQRCCCCCCIASVVSDSVWPHRRQPTSLPCPGILQARTLEWVAISFSSAWKWKVKVKLLSRVRLFETPWTAAYQAPPSMGFSRQEYWSGMPLSSPYKGLGDFIG